MSERIVNDPSLHGWVEENGKWVWEGGATTGHIEDGTIQGQITTWDVAKTEWTPDGTVVVSGGNVGIGTSGSFTSGLDVSTSGSSLSPSGAKITGRFSVGDVKSTSVMLGANTDGTPCGVVAGANELGFYTYDGGWYERMRIDSSGNVGIGGLPANNNAKLWMHGPICVGKDGGNWSGFIKTEVDGSDTNFVIANAGGGKGNHIVFETNAGEALRIDGGTGNATFSGSVASKDLIINGPYIYRSAGSGVVGGGVMIGGNSASSVAGLLPANPAGAAQDDLINIGSTAHRFKDAYFSGTVNAQDHVASSDERLKDNITTAPVGLIDSLKGREWEWKESGEKGSGVVAQELEQVLPHLVHEDDEGMKSVSYNGLVAYLIEEVKALRAEVEELKS